jgi:hypothetical protein
MLNCACAQPSWSRGRPREAGAPLFFAPGPASVLRAGTSVCSSRQDQRRPPADGQAVSSRRAARTSWTVHRWHGPPTPASSPGPTAGSLWPPRPVPRPAGRVGGAHRGVPTVCSTASAMPRAPRSSGCIGAAGRLGSSGSIQRVFLPEQASRPTEGLYVSTYPAPASCARLRSSALSCCSLSWR